MARVAIISKKIDPEIQILNEALSSQGHEVSCLTPFKQGTLIEALKFFPHLLASSPDIVHFLFLKKEDRPQLFHWALAQLLQVVPRKIVTISFFYSPDISSLKLLRHCHLVTFGTSGHLLEARRACPWLQAQVMDVLPPLSRLPNHNELPPQKTVEKLVKSIGQYFVVPGSPRSFLKSLQGKSIPSNLASMKFLFTGSRETSFNLESQIGIQDFYLHFDEDSQRGPSGSNIHDLFFAIKNSSGLLLAFSELTVLELQQYHAWSLRSKTPLLASPKQNRSFPGLVLEGISGWVLNEGLGSLRKLLLENPSLKTLKKPDEKLSFHFLDSTTNNLNRLYTKAISLRS